MRHLLEVHAIRTCQHNDLSLATLSHLTADMAAMEHGPIYRDFRGFSKADATFHRTLVAMSGNRFLLQSWKDLHFHLHVGRLYAGAGVIDFGDALHEHGEIVATLQSRNLPRAIEMVDQHIRYAENRLRTLVTATFASTT